MATYTTSTATDAPLARWRSSAIFAVKLVHSLIFLSVAASVLYVFYAGLADRATRLARVALATALAECLIFAVNRFRCPLRGLAEALGAASGQVTDIFLPKWFADRIPFFFTPPLVIGIAAMLGNRRSGRQSHHPVEARRLRGIKRRTERDGSGERAAEAASRQEVRP